MPSIRVSIPQTTGDGPSAAPASGLDVVIGLGGNLGDRALVLARAVQALESVGVINQISDLLETPPVGPPQPHYLNAAVRLVTSLGPHALWARLAAIEVGSGRVRAERWGPRTLDLDILWAGALRVNDADLCIPHVALAERPFALVPLLQVAPEASDPATGSPYRELLPQGPQTGFRVLWSYQWQRLRSRIGTLAEPPATDG